jgi:hypothetical protein
MRKIRLLGLAFLAVCGLSALLAAPTFAVLTFATAKWLADGNQLAAATNAEFSGSIKLENTENGSAVECAGLFLGTVGPNGEDSTTTVLSVGGTIIPELDEFGATGGLACTSLKVCEAGDAQVYPIGLPFRSIATLDEVDNKFYDLTLNSEFFILCLLMGVEITELCVAAPNGLSFGEVVNLPMGVETVGAIEPLANCNGHEEIGLESFVTGNLTILINGELLAVSE